MANQERVQKILAQAGITSRRKAEELITEGLVTINGKVAKLGDKAEFGKDAIKVKGKLLVTKEEPVYLAFYKPKGVISMLADNEKRPTLADFLGKIQARVFPIGRLDFNSEGLIILTNDGAFAEKMQKAEGIARVYHVKVRGRPDASRVTRLEKGARIGNKLIRPHSIRMSEELANKISIEAVFTDSGAVDVKALFDFTGFLVERITRTAIGQITLKGLVPGAYRFLKESQVEALLAQPELGLKRVERLAEVERESRPIRTMEGGFNYRRPEGAPKKEKRGVIRRAAGSSTAAGGKVVISPVSDETRAANERGESPRPRPSKSWGDDRFSRGPRRDGDRPQKKRFGAGAGAGEKRGSSWGDSSERRDSRPSRPGFGKKPSGGGGKFGGGGRRGPSSGGPRMRVQRRDR